MSVTLKIDNYGSANILQQTQLDADAAASQAVLVVKNNSGFAASDYVLVGEPGAETSELRSILSVAGTTGITMTANFGRSHNQFEKATKLFGNKIKIYRASNVNGSQPADASFSLLATSDITADETSTVYTDTNGSSDYWYKFVYYNSTTDTSTALADSGAVRGGNVGDYASIESIRNKAGFTNNRYVTDSMIDEHRQAAQAEINGKLASRYTVPFTAPINPFIADITRRLAAGYLWLDQYGKAYVEDSTDKGSLMVKSAKDDLTALQNGSSTLLNETGTDISNGSTGGGIGFDGWANDDTETTATADGGSERNFRIGDVQGYSGRKY